MRDESFFIEVLQEWYVQQCVIDVVVGCGVCFVIEFDDGEICGWMNFNNIVCGVFWSVDFGYWIDCIRIWCGFVGCVVVFVVVYVCEEFGLYCLQVLMFLYNLVLQWVFVVNGFECIGFVLKYLCIVGEWQDYLLFQLLLEELFSFWWEGF